MQLRPYQQEVHNDCMEYLKAANYQGPAIINASVGAGKSVLIAAIAKHCQDAPRLKDRPVRAISIQRSGELCSQNSEAAFAYGVNRQSIFSASLNRKSNMYPIIFATEGTLYRALKTEFVNHPVDILMIDECFTGDTLITTKNGLFRIDDPDLINQEVLCVSENTGNTYYHKPDNVLQRGIKHVSCVKTSKGGFTCTPTHKIYTGGSWVEAENLVSSQKIVFQDLQSCAMKRLIRASVAVVRKLTQILLRQSDQ